MKVINITNTNQNLSQLISDINTYSEPIMIVNNNGKNAILISEDKWKNIEETLYLSSIPNYIDNINEIRKKENWESDKKYNPNEKW